MMQKAKSNLLEKIKAESDTTHESQRRLKPQRDECSAAPKVSLLSRRKSENVCEICGIKFFYKSALMRHKAHQHNLL
ncbi:hypothetical protein HUJ05_004586 [Dendroctonus ponderosae]|nr:hypothetical protein HUJ05_004586 [Dendroctonus ponderosae]